MQKCKSIGEEQMKKNNNMQQEKDTLQRKIEELRKKLNYELEHSKTPDEYYEISVQLDKLIADYVDLCEQEPCLT